MSSKIRIMGNKASLPNTGSIEEYIQCYFKVSHNMMTLEELQKVLEGSYYYTKYKNSEKLNIILKSMVLQEQLKMYNISTGNLYFYN